MKIIHKIEENIIGIGLAVTVLLVFLNVVLRYVFKNSSTWIEELVRYIIIWITFIGAAVCFRKSSHMGIDLIFSFVKGPLKKGIEIFILVASLIFVIFLMNYGMELALFTQKSGQIAPSLGIKLFWIYLGIPLGASLAFLEIVILLFKKLKSN